MENVLSCLPNIRTKSTEEFSMESSTGRYKSTRNPPPSLDVDSSVTDNNQVGLCTPVGQSMKALPHREFPAIMVLSCSKNSACKNVLLNTTFWA